MADINDLLQQIAFLRAGGTPSGQESDIQKIGNIFGSISKIGENKMSRDKAYQQEEANRLAIEKAKAEMETPAQTFGLPNQQQDAVNSVNQFLGKVAERKKFNEATTQERMASGETTYPEIPQTITTQREALSSALGLPAPLMDVPYSKQANIASVVKAYKENQPTSIEQIVAQKVRNGEMSFKDALAWKQAASTIPGLSQVIGNAATQLGEGLKTATKQAAGIAAIDKALQLVNTGNVTGKLGQFKAFMAPYLEAVGYKNQNLDEAQTYQLLARAITGPMRLDIIGPGQVSEYEQKLMQQMSGGGGTGQAAARELLSFYRDRAITGVNTYNSMLSGAGQLSPYLSTFYKPIQIPSGTNHPQPNPNPNPTPGVGGRIRVRDKASGQTGTIEANEFDPNAYERIP